jgi:hypothetical protein
MSVKYKMMCNYFLLLLKHLNVTICQYGRSVIMVMIITITLITPEERHSGIVFYRGI